MTTSQIPILIAGPTASGKSALALTLAQQTNGCIINADAIQIYACWRILSARPSEADEALAPHHLYGHVDHNATYSTGHWLRDVEQQLSAASCAGQRPIIIGGTGLYFSALTQGLAEIPPPDAGIRAAGNDIRETQGTGPFLDYLRQYDPETLAQIDVQNPVRLQRAWEVHKTTGIGMTEWHAKTPPPVLAPADAIRLVMDCDRDWLAERIDRRFDIMMSEGALGEVENVLELGWDPLLPYSQAIGARQLIACAQGRLPLNTAVEQAKAQSRQYAKRQRTWFRSRMRDWQKIDANLAVKDPETVARITIQPP
ncbi:MAG: tRNA (adenosine(37)-N6)-dimethylallyltransferase MiaA [Rhodobacteraceae bacterium]|nr:tRNA (adenosine(37)-N6)-dimethylallyltransferase MiaA [Paracoccaceae bacterium]